MRKSLMLMILLMLLLRVPPRGQASGGITISNPSSKSSWGIGDHEITFTEAKEAEDVAIYLFKGSEKVDTISGWARNDGAYSWHISKEDIDEWGTGSGFKIYIEELVSSTFWGETDDDPIESGYSEAFTLTHYIQNGYETICPGEPLSMNVNVDTDTTYVMTYEFNQEPNHPVKIYLYDNLGGVIDIKREWEITDKRGQFEYKADKTEVLSIYASIEIGCVGLKIGFSKRLIPGFPPFAFISVLILALVHVCLCEKRKIMKEI